ncbi:MAG: hypothetical protein M1504_03155, partial [Candidatus Marsarchaeota archaeon]|nr:hypothetical protein [Candidatus Marsarchaeota archaeon]
MLATSINVATLIIVIIGVYMVFLGLSLLYNFANLYPYAAGLPVIIIGMAFLFLFFLRTNRNKK